MIIGYSVLYLNEDTSVKDILWSRRVVYSTWEKAISIASEKAKEVVENWDGSFIVSVIKASSKTTCEETGLVLAFTIKHRVMGEMGEVYLIPVFDE